MAARELTESQREWLRVRAYLQENRQALSELAVARYPDVPKVGGSSLLSNQAWLPDEPISLESIELSWTPDHPRPGLFPADELTEHLRPIQDGNRYPSYSAAMADLAAPAVFQNRTTYRLRSAHLGRRSRMDFEPGHYFDGIDVGEACAHELAAHTLGLIEATPLRDAIGDPCRPSRRPTNVAIAALTLRHDRTTGDATFPLHWRDPAKVGHAGGTYMVIPVGVFQSTGDDPRLQLKDLSLFDCLVREYREEMLGLPESAGDIAGSGALWPRVEAATQRGDIGFHVLGMGTDPLTFATDLLVAGTFEADLYDELFLDVVTTNSEGRLVEATCGGAANGRFAFTNDEIEQVFQTGRLQAAGAATLRLSSHRRDHLLASVPR